MEGSKGNTPTSAQPPQHRLCSGHHQAPAITAVLPTHQDWLIWDVQLVPQELAGGIDAVGAPSTLDPAPVPSAHVLVSLKRTRPPAAAAAAPFSDEQPPSSSAANAAEARGRLGAEAGGLQTSDKASTLSCSREEQHSTPAQHTRNESNVRALARQAAEAAAAGSRCGDAFVGVPASGQHLRFQLLTLCWPGADTRTQGDHPAPQLDTHAQGAQPVLQLCGAAEVSFPVPCVQLRPPRALPGDCFCFLALGQGGFRQATWVMCY